jgi:RNA polymerase sigma factor CnrH
MDHPDGQIANGWSRDDLAALWREHRGWVAAVLCAHMPRSNRSANIDLDDLLQEVAMSLVANITRLESPERIGPWLRTVAINVARDAGRRFKVRRNTVHAGDALGLMSSRDRQGADDARARGRHALEIAHSLPADYREPLLLNLRGLTHKQIGSVMDLPPSTIESRLFRARAMVRKELLAAESREEIAAEPQRAQKSLKPRMNTDAHG